MTAEAVDVLMAIPPCEDQVRALRLLGQLQEGIDAADVVRTVIRRVVIERALAGGAAAVRHGEGSGTTTGDRIVEAPQPWRGSGREIRLCRTWRRH